jgi:ribosome biogenesis GTPase
MQCRSKGVSSGYPRNATYDTSCETRGLTDAAAPGPWAALAAWGWDEQLAKSFEMSSLAADEPGRVLRADRGACLVVLAGGEQHAPLAGDLGTDASLRPTTGDWVVVRGGEVVSVLERRTAVVRASSDERGRPQVLAANVDNVLVVEALAERWRPRRIERFLVLAWQSGALPSIVFTKSDLCRDVASAIASASAIAPGVAIHAVSSVDGTGMDLLASSLAPRTTAVVLGRSGAGKSTLANALSGGATDLATSAVRGDNKGRHTTVTRELVQLANGSLFIDTPGLRAIGLVDGDGLGDAFPDVGALAERCRFSDCAHASEPGCAVNAAIAAGQLDRERLESYQRLLADQLRLAEREDARLRAERTAERRTFTRQSRRSPRH